MTSCVTNIKKIRDMDASEIEIFANELIKDPNYKFLDLEECYKQYEQLTGNPILPLHNQSK